MKRMKIAKIWLYLAVFILVFFVYNFVLILTDDKYEKKSDVCIQAEAKKHHYTWKSQEEFWKVVKSCDKQNPNPINIYQLLFN